MEWIDLQGITPKTKNKNQITTHTSVHGPIVQGILTATHLQLTPKLSVSNYRIQQTV